LIKDWQNGAMKQMTDLLSKYETLGASVEIVHQYLQNARQILQVLAPSNGRAGLLGLTDYLAHQTDALGGCA